jgi:hypothetical protein
VVVPGPEWTGVGAENDAWAHFEATLGMDEVSLGASTRRTSRVTFPNSMSSSAWWWRTASDADSDRRRLTPFPHVARGLTCQRCVAAAVRDRRA